MAKQQEPFETPIATPVAVAKPSRRETSPHAAGLDSGIDPAWSKVADELEERKPCGTVGTYQPRGSAHGDRRYFRFSYRDGNRMKHKHVPGGNVDNSVARQRAEAVRQAIARGANVEEVLQLIKKSGS